MAVDNAKRRTRSGDGGDAVAVCVGTTRVSENTTECDAVAVERRIFILS